MNKALDQVSDLWPGARVSRRPGRQPALLILPTAHTPRMLVPTGVPAAHVMLKRHSRSRLQTLAQESLAFGVRSRLLELLPIPRLVADAASQTVEDHVREQVPDAARVGVLLGPPRANAKPVLQVFGADGKTLAFGKVGHDPGAAALVRHEAQVLADGVLQRLDSVEVPAVLATGSWNGLQLLLMTPMSSSQQRSSSWALPTVAIHEVAESCPSARSTVGASTYWADLSARVAALPGQLGSGLAARMPAVQSTVSETELGFGRWHGDWSRWNMGHADGRLELWDWEQSGTDVPLGFDAVHFVMQREFRHGSSALEAVDALRSDTSAVLDRWYATGQQVDVTLLLYLVEILHRYAAQDRGDATSQLLDRRAKLLELVDVLTAGAGKDAGPEPEVASARQTPQGRQP